LFTRQVFEKRAEKVKVNPVNESQGTLMQILTRYDSLLDSGSPPLSNDSGTRLLAMIMTPLATISYKEERLRGTHTSSARYLTANSAITAKKVKPRNLRFPNRFAS
jgi:hypothetical protein